jgi:hypothetical protein
MQPNQPQALYNAATLQQILNAAADLPPQQRAHIYAALAVHPSANAAILQQIFNAAADLPFANRESIYARVARNPNANAAILQQIQQQQNFVGFINQLQGGQHQNLVQYFGG